MAVDQTDFPLTLKSRSNRWGRQILDSLIWTFLVIGLSGCVQHGNLHTLAVDHGLQTFAIPNTDPPIYALRNAAKDGGTLTVYLGGDGVPYKGNRPSPDPTGPGLMAAHLAITDLTPAYYLGRPCYHLERLPEKCQPASWTSNRYSEDTVTTLAAAVGTLIRAEGASSAKLVGYSGGGVLAVLVAARMGTIDRVTTVAANLDTDAWTRFHGLQPLTGSLNPAVSLSRPTEFEQVHLLGEYDTLVPPPTIRRFRDNHPEAAYLVVEGFDHRCCWRDLWVDILDQTSRDLAILRETSFPMPAADAVH